MRGIQLELSGYGDRYKSGAQVKAGGTHLRVVQFYTTLDHSVKTERETTGKEKKIDPGPSSEARCTSLSLTMFSEL